MSNPASAVLNDGTETEEKNSSAVMLLLKLRTLIALIIVTAYFCIMAPNFISLGNLVIISKHVAINAFLAIGMTYVIVTGGIDLSVGSIVGLVGMQQGAAADDDPGALSARPENAEGHMVEIFAARCIGG